MKEANGPDHGQRPCMIPPGAGCIEWDVEDVKFEGILRELSLSHFGAFVRQSPEPIREATKDLPNLLCPCKDIVVSITLRGQKLPPLQARVCEWETSWIRGYRFFVIGNFCGMSKQDTDTLAGVLAEEKKRMEGLKPQIPPIEVTPLTISGAEAIRITFPAKRAHARVFRALCESVAQQANFGPREIFMIKLAADEVFTNAVIHGSTCYGRSRITSDIVVDDEGITILVRDEGGRPFDYQRHQVTEKGTAPQAKQRSGLDIVAQTMDSWAVRIEQGKFTEVIFRKKRSGN